MVFSAFVIFGTFGLSYLLTRGLCAPNSPLFILDHPNERSLHVQPTPRGGGIAIAAAIFLGGTVLELVHSHFDDRYWLGFGAFVIALVSFIDDRFKVPPLFRLMAHIIVALVLAYHGFVLTALDLPGIYWPLSTVLGVLLSCLFLVWLVNLYNFMDGMDGFAAGMAVIGFGCFGLLGLLAEHEAFAILSVIVAAAALGFLVSNFPPARIFMGDVGSSLLGLLAAALSLWADREGVFPLWVGVLVFSPFIVDATVTLVRRIAAGERIWEAHKSHFYQRLVQLGWGHRRTVLWEYVLMLACGASAIVASAATPTVQWVIVILWAGVYGALIRVVGRLENGFS